MAPALQISIPTTSEGEQGGKAYTLYHVQLALPIRTHETCKRYSDFVALHDSLVSQTAAAPPVPLPSKSWLRRTIGNPALTEQRRRGLEAYARAIVDAQDARWRSSTVWRHFLGLPQDDKQHKLMTANDSVADPAAWLDLHRDVKSQLHNARQLLKKRDAASSAQEQHAISADAKAALVRAATGLARLDAALANIPPKTKHDDDDGTWGQQARLGDGEIRRRRDMIGAARAETESLESSLKSLQVKPQGSMLSATSAAAAASDADKRALWGDSHASTTRSSRRVLGGPAQETDRTRELDNQGVLQLQKRVMGEQEQDVLEIGKAVTRMKEMGIMINEELVVQNQMLTHLDQDTDRFQGKLDVAKKRIKKIN
jgi:regulator of vacuolar morphogenesis